MSNSGNRKYDPVINALRTISTPSRYFLLNIISWKTWQHIIVLKFHLWLLCFQMTTRLCLAFPWHSWSRLSRIWPATTATRALWPPQGAPRLWSGLCLRPPSLWAWTRSGKNIIMFMYLVATTLYPVINFGVCRGIVFDRQSFVKYWGNLNHLGFKQWF